MIAQRVPPTAPGKAFSVLIKLYCACRSDLMAERKLFAGATAAVVLTVFFRILEPWPLKFIYDFIFRHGHERAKEVVLFGFTFSLQGTEHRFLMVWVAVLGLLVFGGLAGLFDYLSTLAMGVAASRVLSKLRINLFRHLQSMDMGFHALHKAGDLTASVTGDIDRLRDVTVSAMLPFVSNTLVLLAMTAVMIFMNWKLGLLVLVAFPAFYFVVQRITTRIQAIAREQRLRDGGISAIAAEALGGIRTIQAFGLEEEFVHRFSGDNGGSLVEGNRAQRLSARLERTVDLFASIVTGGVLLLGAKAVLDGKLTAGDLIVFVSYLRNSFKPIRQTAKYLAQIARALASGGRVISLLEEEPVVQNVASAITAPRLRGRIRFDHVSYEYRPGHPALHDISFELLPGERVAIVGPSGSGKSTLASLLLRFQDPQSGSISIDGIDIRNYLIASLRAQIAFVMQDSVLFTGSIAENIGFGSRGIVRPYDIHLAASKARASEFVERMPEGYDTHVDERGATLSGGQRQRIAIARAYLRDSTILLLDEATTGLDGKNQALVLSALRELREGRTTIFITHDIPSAKDADRILFLCDGRLEEQGTHESLMRKRGGYAAMCQHPQAAQVQEGMLHAV